MFTLERLVFVPAVFTLDRKHFTGKSQSEIRHWSFPIYVAKYILRLLCIFVDVVLFDLSKMMTLLLMMKKMINNSDDSEDDDDDD